MVYEYQCKKCGKIQERWHGLNDTNHEPCEECKAPPEELKRVIALTAGKNKSWAAWSQNDD